MRVLVACEFSGIVRDAFRERGHDAWSCDLLPTERPGNHYQSDALVVASLGWDLMIAHPPCTYLCNSGVRWLYGKGKKADGGMDLKRWEAMGKASKFFLDLLNAPIPRIAVENPRMHSHALLIIKRPPTQTIQPYLFGHGETKETGLWLKNLPPLAPTDAVEGRKARTHFESPGPNRWKNRSRTLAGIAKAMAEQWGGEAVP